MWGFYVGEQYKLLKYLFPLQYIKYNLATNCAFYVTPSGLFIGIDFLL